MDRPADERRPLDAGLGRTRRCHTAPWESRRAADPDAIVVGPCGFDIEKTHAAIAELDANDTWRTLRAVRDGRVHAIDGNAYLNRPGPRLVDTAEIIETVLRGPARTAT